MYCSLFGVTGFTTVMIDLGEEKQWQPDRCVNHRGMLSVTQVKAVFARLIREAIEDLPVEYRRYCLTVSNSDKIIRVGSHLDLCSRFNISESRMNVTFSHIVSNYFQLAKVPLSAVKCDIKFWWIHDKFPLYFPAPVLKESFKKVY